MNGARRSIAGSTASSRASWSIADLEAAGLLEKIEPTTHAVPHAERGNAVIEPWLTDQWYVNAAELAKRAIAVVESGETRFVPKNWEKTYFEWMRNIQPWCISRQIWWGHQIPAWYGPRRQGIRCALRAASVDQEHCGDSLRQSPKAVNRISMIKIWTRRGRGLALRARDEDVLDTWFSSALWPFSTLGWPEKTKELKRFYPTSALVTGFDIIFFWVARMMMMGLHFMKEVPFRDVYIHALVRDEKGQKMSKSKGNVMDPLTSSTASTRRAGQKRTTAAGRMPAASPGTRARISRRHPAYGADALRFTLAAMAAQGRDIKLSLKAVEGYRNFATKLWNAARFAEMNECVRQKGFDPKAVEETVNRWIAGEVERTADRRHRRHRGLQVQRGGRRHLRVHLGHVLRLVPGADQAGAERRRRGGQGRDARHHRLGARPDPEAAAPVHAVHHRGAVGRGWSRSACSARTCCASVAWPAFEGLADAEADEEIGWLVALISEVRSVRSEMNVPGGAKMPLVLVGAGKAAARARRAARGDHQAAGPARRHLVRQGAAQGRGADRAGRDDGGAAAGRRHRHGRRARAPGARDRQVRRPRSPRSTPSSPTPTSSPRRRPRWWRRTASARPTSRRPSNKLQAALKRVEAAT